MKKSSIKSNGFSCRNALLLATLLFLSVVLIAAQYTQFVDSAEPLLVGTNMFSDSAYKLQSLAYDASANQRIYPLSDTSADGSRSFIDNNNINHLVGDQPHQLPLADFNFAAAGDWDCNSNSQQTVSNIVERSPELVLGLGDYSYRSSAACWLEMIDPIDTLTRIAIGNHDGESSRLTNQYLSHFGLEEQFYSFDYQNVHFLVVSSEIPFTEGSDQYNFVNNDLASAASNSSIDWIVAYHHRMQYTSTTDEHDSESSLRDALHPLFDEYGVDLVLQAHNHSYERTYPLQYDSASPSSPIITDSSESIYNDSAGVIYITVGTAGSDLYEYIEKEPYSVIQWIGFGFLNIDMINNGLTMKGTLYSNDGTINDSFTINKSGSTIGTTSRGTSTASNITTTTTTISTTDSTTLVTPLSFVENPSTPILLGHTEPEVIKVDDKFYMYYRNDVPTSGASINVMSSIDGLKWIELGAVLTNSSSGWDSAEVIAPSVYFDGNTYYLYYEADDADEPGKRAIGVATATSPTGPFAKYSGNPVLEPTLQWEGVTSSGYGITGTPVITRGGTSNGIFYLFYHGSIDGADKIGVAYSNNPLGPWKKEPNNPILGLGPSGSWDDAKVAPSSVYLYDTTRVMVFYEGFNGIKEHIINWRIGIADGRIDSDDGRIKSLTRLGAPALDLGTSDSWNDTTAQLPSVIRVQDKFWMYYSGNDGQVFRLGRAVAQVP